MTADEVIDLLSDARRQLTEQLARDEQKALDEARQTAPTNTYASQFHLGRAQGLRAAIESLQYGIQARVGEIRR